MGQSGAKMATITKRGDLQWQAKVRKKGFPVQSRTFMTRADAERWAKETEIAMERGLFFDRTAAEQTTVGGLVEKYREQVLPTKRGNHFGPCLDAIEAEFGEQAVARINSQTVATWRDKMTKEAGLAASTIRKRLAVLSKLLDLGHSEWGVSIADNPVKAVKKPPERNARERRLVGDEESRLLGAVSVGSMAGDLIRLGLETGARLGELWSIEWADVDPPRRVVRVRGLSGEGSKNGEERDVPLSSAAVAVFKGMARPLKGGRVFACWGSVQAAHHAWANLLARARRRYLAECEEAEAEPDDRLTDLRFHDLRHEAASRLADKLSVHELAKMLGWRSIQMAMRYYHPRAEDLARKLG